MPALETRMSMPPKRAAAAAMPASTSLSLVTSIATAMARSPVASNSSAVAWAAAMFKSAMTILAPLARKTLAMSLPMPLAAPVMTATLFCRFMVCFPVCVGGEGLFAFRYRDVESVEGGRDHSVQADQVDQFIGAVLAEGGHAEPVQRLRQHAAAHQRIGYIEGHAFVGGEIGRLQIGHQRRQTLGRHAFALGDGDVGVHFVGRV